MKKEKDMSKKLSFAEWYKERYVGWIMTPDMIVTAISEYLEKEYNKEEGDG